ncbi:MAG: hypothetical protein EOP52_11035 [Sphingobacteriales bacterium]|nr:MAG: hypothetical protein EOP52_11035 [Sphingobacteriales bacterium]
MGCGNCGTRTADGKPAGCKSNGGCSSGGCNKMNVYDWLAGLPLYDGLRPYPILEISFNQGSRKEFFRNTSESFYEKGDSVVVEGTSGIDVGMVSLTGELVKLQMKKYGVTEEQDLKKILRLAVEEDQELLQVQKARTQEFLVRSRAMARSAGLDMKIAEVEIQADGKKVTIYYTAEQRIDFREIIRSYATEFKARVEMRQIGPRQESGKVGGIGSCGRELCCSTWLTDFKAVNTGAARYQNLSINQVKLAGQCGRLKCCLNYELDTYMDALKGFPSGAEKLEVAKGLAYLQKKDIFRNLMWYTLPGSSRQYPLTLDRVREIQALNKEGTRPEELGAIEIETAASKTTEADSAFVNDVGQVSLRSLERSNKKHKKAKKDASKQLQAPNEKPVSRKATSEKSSRPQQSRSQTGSPKAVAPGGAPKPEGDRKPKQNRPERKRPTEKPANDSKPDSDRPAATS